VWAALAAAHDGPAFEGAASDFPYSFELDERNDPGASHDILHMGVGAATLLGVVRGRGLERLADGREAGPTAALTGGPSSSSSPPPPPPPSSSSSSSADAEARLPNLTTSLFGVVGGADEPASPQNPIPAGEARVVGTYDRLEFVYQGRVVASAVMFGSGGGVGARQGAEDEDEEQELEEHYEGKAPGRAAAQPATNPPPHVVQSTATNPYGPAATPPLSPAPSVPPSRRAWESENFFTVFAHTEDGARGRPIAHVLGATGSSALSFRRVISLLHPGVEAGGDEAGADDDGPGPDSQSAASQIPLPPPPLPPSPSSSRLLPDPSAWVLGAQREVRQQVVQAAFDEFGDGHFRRHTVRLPPRPGQAVPRNPFADDTVAPAHGGAGGGGAGGLPALAPDSHAGADDAARARLVEAARKAARDGVVDEAGERLCNPRLHSLADPHGGIGALKDVREKLERMEAREPGSAARALEAAAAAAAAAGGRRGLSSMMGSGGRGGGGRGGGGGGVAHPPRPLAAFNASHWWPRGGEDPTIRAVPTFSAPLDGGQGGPGTGPDAFPSPPSPAAATHTLVSFRTPGVHHLRWLRARTKGSVPEASATRVRLPDSRFWLWEPRSPAHARGGWEVNIHPRRLAEEARGAFLHPAVYALTAAVLTLEREFDSALREEGKGVTARLARVVAERGAAGVESLWGRLGWGLGDRKPGGGGP
jgi:hypothetical protein